jgi:hypothetical protein
MTYRAFRAGRQCPVAMKFLSQAERILRPSPSADMPMLANRIPANHRTCNMATMAFIPTDYQRGL